ncbi:LysR family transcriptional regulator [Acidovorax sp. LjRoot74]|uniref:LysR family transcriptional regulator n=1 Tax=Acidovorax sp. LjRoot74 TaxID=3342337 RepID=UPI003ECD531D
MSTPPPAPSSRPGANAQVLQERMLGRLRLRHLRLLAALECNTTLREAAESVGITQPAASQALRELEDMLEVALFERHAKGLRATEAGRFMAQQSRQMLGSVGYAAEALAASARGVAHPLHISAIPAALSSLVRPRMGALRHALRDWRVTFHEGMPDDMAASLHSGLSQMALVRRPATLPDHRLLFTPLGADEIVVAAAPEHPARPRQPGDRLRLQALAGYPFSVPMGVSVTFNAFMQACDQAGFTPLQAPMQSISALLLLAVTGDAHTLAALPRSIALPWLERGELIELPLQKSIALPPLGALTRADDVSPAVRVVLRVLQT